MSNVYQITTKAELTKSELNGFLNGDRNVFRIPEARGVGDFFSVSLGKESLPIPLQSLPDDVTLTVGKHMESGKGEHLDRYHVVIQYTQWKEKLEVCEFEFLKDYSSQIAQHVIDLDSDIQGTHFLDFPHAPCFVYATVYSDGKEIQYQTNAEVLENLYFYQSLANLDG